MGASARPAGTAGLCAAILAAAAIAVAGMAPDADADAAALQSYVGQHRAGIVMSFALFQLALPFMFVFFAGLAKAVGGANDEAAAFAWGGFAGGVGLQLVALAGAIPFVAAAWRGADDAVLRAAYDGNLLALYALTAGLSIASVLLPTIAGLITRTLPAWTALFALVVVAANVGELVGFVFYDAGPMALGVGPGLIAVPGWTLWMGAVSIALLRRAKG
jgi:hypothetical protein